MSQLLTPSHSSVFSIEAVSQLAPVLPLEGTEWPVVAVPPPAHNRLQTATDPTLAVATQTDFALPRSRQIDRTVRLWLTATPLLMCDWFIIGLLHPALSWLVGWPVGMGLQPNLMAETMTILLAYAIAGKILHLFPATGMSPVLELRQTTLALGWSCLTLIIANSLLATLVSIEVVRFCSLALVGSLCLPIARTFLRGRLARCPWWGERAMIVGMGKQGAAIARFYQQCPQSGIRPIGFVSDLPKLLSLGERSVPTNLPRLGDIEHLPALGVEHQCRWAIVTPGGCHGFNSSRAMRYATQLDRVVLLPSGVELPSLWTSAYECAGVAGLQVRDQLRDPLRRAIKRAVDLLLVSWVLVCLLPLMPLLVAYGVWVQIVSPGPLFYGHRRIGRGGRVFRVWKFRTMVRNADEQLAAYLQSNPEAAREWETEEKLRDDPRIIPVVGKWLRKSSLDELPQLLNVLVGEMSIVGPRPRPVDEARNGRCSDRYLDYQRAKPGITGLWQVCGRNKTTYEHRVQLDNYYVRNWSPWLDMYILIRTVRTVLLAEGAY